MLKFVYLPNFRCNVTVLFSWNIQCLLLCCVWSHCFL